MAVRTPFLATTAAAALAVLSLFWGCSGGQDAGDKIKVGSLNSMTGGTSVFGQSSDKGIRLAAEDLNKSGGVLGKPVEIITADTESAADKAVNAVTKLLNQDRVVSVVGEVASSRSLAAAPECQRAGVPMLSPASTNPRVTQVGNYIFRSCFTDDFQGQKIAQFAFEKLGARKGALLTDVKNDYSTGLTKQIDETFTKLGGKIVATDKYSEGDDNFNAQLTRLRDADPDIVFVPGYYTEITKIVKQARLLGLKCPFTGGDGWDSDVTLKDGGKAVEGCYFVNHYSPSDPNPKVQAFVSAFKARYNGQVPDAMAVLGYDGANLMFDAIKRAGSTDGAKLRDALAATKDFPGVTGSITIGPDRNAVKPGVVVKIEDGQFKLVARVTAKGIEDVGGAATGTTTGAATAP